MKKNLTFSYAMIHMMLWATYGFLFSYANPYLTERLMLSDTTAGIILGIATLLSFLLQPLLTTIADKTKLKTRPILLLAGGCTAGFSLLTLCTGTMIELTTVLFAGACVFLQVLPSFSNALGMEAIRRGKQVNFGLARGIGSVSFGLSAKAAAPLIDWIGLEAVAISGGITAFLLVCAVLFFPTSGALQGSNEEKPSSAVEFFRQHPKFVLLLAGTMLLYVGHNVLSNCMFRIAQTKLASGALEEATNLQGTALMIAAVVELPMMFLFTRLVRKVRCDIWLCLSAVFMTLRLVLTLLLPGSFGLYTAQLAQMLGYALFAVSSVYYVGTVIPRKNVIKGQTYLGSANTMGCLFAYFLGGSLIDQIGVESMLLVCILISVIGVGLLFSAREQVRETVGA